MYRRFGSIESIVAGALTCLFAAGVSLAAAEVHGDAPAAASAAHAAPAAAAPPPPSGPAHMASPARPPTDALTPANSAKGQMAQPHTSGKPTPEKTGVNGDLPRRPMHHRDTQYPLGGLYDYWNPFWNAYGGYGSYNYNQETYPGQFNENNSDVEQPAAAPVDAVIPPRQAEADAASPALRSALLASPQWREADEQVKIAQAQYDTASIKVLVRLKAQPSYQQAVARKDQDAQKVASLKAKDPEPSISRAAPVATAKLDAAEAVTNMTNAALAADPQASTAKVKLDTALARREEARQAVEAQIGKSAPAAPIGGGR